MATYPAVRPRLLDLFCGAGGAGMGYHRAGFEVVGVDISPQPHYPFEFHQADALEYLARHGREFDAIHASPPCQGYSVANNIHQRRHPMLIGETRSALSSVGKPWVIENVMGAPMGFSIILCGTLFDLKVYRHRLFEASFAMLAPKCAHPYALMDGYLCIYGDLVRGRQKGDRGNNFLRFTKWDGLAAMGIDWHMTSSEMSEAIPPAYTEYVGARLLAALPVTA